MSHYRTLNVWKEAFNLSIRIHTLTKLLPIEEKFGLSSQMRRAALSIPSNIAEGKGRQSDKELRRFCLIANGSAFELETQLLQVQKLGLTNNEIVQQALIHLKTVSCLLNRFIQTLSKADS